VYNIDNQQPIANVETRKYKNSDKYVSLLGFGGIRLPVLKSDQEIDRNRLCDMINYAIRHGINYFDTAYGYHGGNSEICIGEALSKYPREKYFLADKMPLYAVKSEDDVERIFNEQLEKCKVEYFDFYLLHNFNRNSTSSVEKYNIYEILREKQSKGLIHHFGFSFHDKPEILRGIINKYRFDFVQIQLNYMDWELQNAKLQYEILKENNIPITVMEPVRGGMLAKLCDKSIEIFKKSNPDVSVASWALRYAASFPEVLTVLSGMSNMEQLQDNVKTFEYFKKLSYEEYSIIGNALSVYKKLLIIPCTACRYCMDCPRGIDIPGVFGVYNNYNQSGKYKRDSIRDFLFRYGILGSDRQAHLCIQCKRCTRYCPQNINIPYWMGKINGFYNRIKYPVRIYNIIRILLKRIKKEGVIKTGKYYIKKIISKKRSI
jgi:predicted aldo/keto reductase-like oxidoreductase